MAKGTYDNLIVLQVFRPLSLRHWFEVDPLANTLKGKFVNGVRCEVAEAVCLPEGGQVIWRISGIAQCAENARNLESARARNIHQVNLGTLKVDPVRISCVPNRIITRTPINILRRPTIVLERVVMPKQSEEEPIPKPASKLRRRISLTARKKQAGIRGIAPVELRPIGEVIASAELDVARYDEPQAEIVLRPEPFGDDALEENATPHTGEPAFTDCLEDEICVKEEPLDYVDEVSVQQQHDDAATSNAADVVFGVAIHRPYEAEPELAKCATYNNRAILPTVLVVKQEPLPADSSPLYEENSSSARAASSGHEAAQLDLASSVRRAAAAVEGSASSLNSTSSLDGAASRKRLAREEILRSEKKLKVDHLAAPTDRCSVQRRVIDPECADLQGVASVYVENGDVYDVMLNQTNVEFNNNKYYLLQLAKANDRDQFYVWFRWGRVGKRGQNNLIPCASNLDKAKSLFHKKFYDKTLNNFDERSNFEKVQGKYDLVQVCLDEADSQVLKEEVAKLSSVKQEAVPCHLEPELMSFVELIFSVKKMEAVLKDLNFDSKRSPLGKLTKQQIAAGYAALKMIEDCVSNGIRGRRLTQACNVFYTRIPHDFGMRVPPLICSHEEIRQKIELLETLTDVQFALDLLRRKYAAQGMHPADRFYQSLGAHLEQVTQDELDLLTRYLQVTHAPTHNQYIMRIKAAFTVNKQDEVGRFRSRLPNRMLLWHGSRLSNWASIISQGLRIAPPEAPVTGYMFGKGVYFADSSSKAANYCFPTRAQNEGILLLNEVALGESNELYEADYDAEKLPKGKHSVKGMGRVVPREEEFVYLTSPHDGQPVVVPCGELHDISTNHCAGRTYSDNPFTLNYNEYIVYNVNQIKMRYILRIEFLFA